MNRWLFLLMALASPCAALAAQDIPPYVPANPLLESRSALYAQPFIAAHGGWQIRALSDYYNAVEVSQSPPPDQRQTIFDAEILQADLWLDRDVGRHLFVIFDLPLRGGYDGFLDGFLIRYHALTGLAVPARDALPRNTFQWGFVLPDSNVNRSRPGTFVGDLRTGAGLRLGRAELIASITLPTATLGTDGWTRHVVGTSLALTGEFARTSRLTLDGSLTAGWTPTQGALAKYERSTFVGGLIATRWRFSGQQSLFATVWAQSSNWQDTGFRAVDLPEVSGDFGFLLHLHRSWPELQLGMTQDLSPKGPALDVGFTVGVRWSGAQQVH